MEGISRKDLDRISEILSNYVNTDESIKLASKLTEFDAIPKLYVFTYFNKVYQELKQLKGDGSFDMDEVETMIENFSALNLHSFKTKTEVNKLFSFLSNGFDRLDKFCDFDDSRYHGKKQFGRCENEMHFEDIDPSDILSKEDYDEFDKINEEKGWDEAIEKFGDKLNPETELSPFYMDDEDTQKWKDEPTWTCKYCEERVDGSDYDFSVSCDMELGE